MKYARKQQYKNSVRLIDVVEIPAPLPAWAADADAFLAKMFPMYSDFFIVADDKVAGAVEQVDGSFENPAPPPLPPVKHKSLTQGVVRDDMLPEIFGDNRYLAVLTAIAALTTDAWQVRKKKFDNPSAVFTRQQVVNFLTAARADDVPNSGTGATGKITVAEINAVAADLRWIET